MASVYSDPQVKIGCIFGTGCNAAYMEECSSIPKIKKCKADDTPVVINTECGAFGSVHKVLPRNRFDEQIDRGSLYPGEQTYEKLVAGLYLGQLLRLVLLEFGSKGLIFKGYDTSRLKDPTTLDSKHLSVIEADDTDKLTIVRDLFCARFSIDPEPHECRIIKHLVELIGTRAARLFVCTIAAICKKKKIDQCHVGVDGSAFDKNSKFQEKAAQALREIFDRDPKMGEQFHLQVTEAGSGLGAALVAALAMERDQI